MSCMRSPVLSTPAKWPSSPEFDKELEDLCNTLDKSRKRHLSVGLLRGDQVHDRLKQQESSASPLLKKARVPAPQQPPLGTPPKTPTMALTMADFEAYMERNTNKRLQNIDESVAGIRTVVNAQGKSLEEHDRIIKLNQTNIAEIRDEIKMLKAGPTKQSGDTWRPRPSPSTCPDRDKPPPSSEPRGESLAFDLARRSLRLWPVEGSTQEELWRSTKRFISVTLDLGSQVTQEMMVSVERVEIPSGPGVQSEALVRFRDVSARDLVMGSASKLAPMVDSRGKSTAGMRMEVPPVLRQDFRVLFKYGQTLRARHGQGTRWHVKFDDISRSLYLNVKLPTDESWSRVSIDLARRGIRARQVLNDDEIERRLDITGPIQPRPRATSTTTGSGATADMEWTSRRSGSVSTS